MLTGEAVLLFMFEPLKLSTICPPVPTPDFICGVMTELNCLSASTPLNVSLEPAVGLAAPSLPCGDFPTAVAQIGWSHVSSAGT